MVGGAGDSRMQPLLPSAILCSPQKPGSHRSHRTPPTPGLQWHWRVLGSHVAEYEPRRLHWHVLGQPAWLGACAGVTWSGQQPKVDSEQLATAVTRRQHLWKRSPR